MKETTIRAAKDLTDVAAAATAFAVLAKWLPVVASALSIAWMLWRFYEAIALKLKQRQERRR